MVIWCSTLVHMGSDPGEAINDCKSRVINSSKSTHGYTTVYHKRIKVVWSEQGIADFESLVSPQLSRICKLWCDPGSETSLSILFSITNEILKEASSITNKTKDLGEHLKSRKSVFIPKSIRISQKALLAIHKRLLRSSPLNSGNLKQEYLELKTEHRKLLRMLKAKERVQNDQKLFSIYSKNPMSLFKSIRYPEKPVQARYQH